MPQGAGLPAASSPQGTAVLEVRPLADRIGVRAAGEVSLNTRTAWQRELTTLVGRGDDVYLELSGVTFIDVAGASALAVAAQSLDSGRRMVLDHPPPALRRTLELFWPDLPAIEVTTF
ncbi:STAS domain-containing protein [Streptomyces sp. NPDC004647]|uniref:STAS domain-containing protein n=1 Tax=Streptomyces sp. NPDC004647 TaxID=3154671 RepID=UPI0033B76DA4